MAKESWGKKRTCPKCDTRFYDLNKDPLICPNCEHTFSLDSIMEVFKKSTKDTSPKKSTDEKNSSEIEGIEPEDIILDDEFSESIREINHLEFLFWNRIRLLSFINSKLKKVRFYIKKII